MQTFRLVERSPKPGCHEILVVGELDLAVADQLKRALAAASGHDRILIGLQDCQFIDSTGIATIVEAHHSMGAAGRHVAVYAPHAQVRRILSITGLTDNGLVFESAEEALSADGPPPARPR